MSRAIRRDDEAISEEAIAAEKLLAQPENARGARAAGRTGGSQIPPASIGCRQRSHTRGARGGAKGIRRLCGAPLHKVRCAQRRGARRPLNIQELEHPPVTATGLATFAPSASAVKPLLAEAGIKSEILQRFLTRSARIAAWPLTKRSSRKLCARIAELVVQRN